MKFYNDLLENSKNSLGLMCLAAAWLFPFSSGGSRDAMQQMFGLAMFGVASLLFGMTVIPLLSIALLATAILLIAVMPSNYIGGQMAGLAGITLLGVAMHVGAHLQRKPAQLAWLLFAIVIAAFVNALEGLLQLFGLVSGLWPWVVEPEKRGVAFGAFRQQNLFATFLCVGVVCVNWLVQARRLTEAMAWFLLVILVFAITASGSRSGGLELIALAMAGLLWRKQQSSVTTRLQVGPVFLYGLATVLLPIASAWHSISFVTGAARVADVSQDSRLILWRNAIALIRERPWTGWGWREMSYGHYMTLLERRRAESLDNAHNLFLQVAVEFGLPIAFGLMVTLLWLIYVGRPWRVALHSSQINQNNAFARQFAWSILMLIGIHSMVEFPLWFSSFLFLTGLAVGFLQHVSLASIERSKYGLWRTKLGLMGALFLIALACVAWNQYATVLQIYKAPFNDQTAQRAAIAKAEASSIELFRGHVEFAAISQIKVTPENAPDVRQKAEKLLHFSAEPAVIRQLLESLFYLKDIDAFDFHAERFCRAFPVHFHHWVKEFAAKSTSLDVDKLPKGCLPKVS